MGQHEHYGKKYVVTGETREVDGKLLWQIKATRDIRGAHCIRTREGSLGGWLQYPGHDHESQRNRGFGVSLDQEDESWVEDRATVMDRARVFGDARVNGRVIVRGSASVYERASVGGNATLTDNVQVSGDAYLYGDLHLSDAVEVRDNACVEGSAKLSGSVTLRGHTMVAYGAQLSGGNFHHGSIRRRARVEKSDHVIVVDGLFPDPVTIYRADAVGNHYVTAGCQTFQLDWDLEEIAREHGWELPRYWRSFRQVMLKAVKKWEPVINETDTTETDEG